MSVAGEASPYHLFHPAAAERATADLPAARVIALLREPVARAYSNFWDRKTFGSEEFDRFEDALEAEPDRLASVDQDRLRHDPHYYSFHHDHHSYRARGRYAEQLRAYFAVFPRDQLLVLPLDALKRDAMAAFRRIEAHLDIEHHPVDLSPRNAREGNPPIPAETRERLMAYYAPYNQELRELLGEDFGW